MIEIQAVESDEYNQFIRDLYWEYLQWVNGRIVQEYRVSFDIAAILERDMADVGRFRPPTGRMLLAYVDGSLAGMACLKEVGGCCGEIKRMYVRPSARRMGLGRLMLKGLLDEAAALGYNRIRLDSACFMTEAHQLYRSMGFEEIEPYEGSEIPPDFQHNWVFMQKDLEPAG